MKKTDNLSTLAVGLTGLFLVIKSLTFLPTALSWSLYLISMQNGESMGGLIASIVAQGGAFSVFLIAGVLVLWKRQKLGLWLCSDTQQLSNVEMNGVARPLVGVVGIWFFISGVTYFITTSARENPPVMKNPYYIAYGLQALSGLYLLVANRVIARFLSTASRIGKEMKCEPSTEGDGLKPGP